MTEYYSLQFPKPIRKSNVPSFKAKQPVSKWCLVYRVGKGADQVIVTGAYPICQAKKNELKGNANYRLGEFFIKPAKI